MSDERRDPVVDDPKLKAAVKSLGEAVQGSLGPHPEPEDLAAYHRRELPESEAEALEEHLAWCRECAALARDIPLLSEEPPDEADEDELAADWEALRSAAFGPEGQEAREAPPAPLRTTTRRSGVPAWAAALAASLVVALGSGLWVHQLRDEVAGLRAPRANVAIHDLASPSRATPGDAPAVVDPTRRSVLVLNTLLPEDGRYEARFLDASGEAVEVVPGLVPGTYGNLTLELPAGFLPPGEYRIELVSDRGETVDELSVRVAGPDDAR